jgi:hypothetical protein
MIRSRAASALAADREGLRIRLRATQLPVLEPGGPRAVWQTRGRKSERGSTYTIDRELPTGRLHNEWQSSLTRRPGSSASAPRRGPLRSLPVPVLHGESGNARPSRRSSRADRRRGLAGPARRAGNQARSGRQLRRAQTPPRGDPGARVAASHRAALRLTLRPRKGAPPRRRRSRRSGRRAVVCLAADFAPALR